MAETDQTFDERLASFVTQKELPTLPVDEPDKISFRWQTYNLLVDAEHFTSDGQTELTFWQDSADHTALLLQTRINLLSSSNVASVTRRLRNCDDGLGYLPWDWILTCITYKVLRNARESEPMQTIWPADGDSLAPAYLLEPVLYLNHPTIIFGDYGALKSLFALVLAYIVQLPLKENRLGLITADNSTICLYADYEDDPVSFQKRWGAIQRGFGVEAPMPILYRRMTEPLADSVESLRKAIRENKVSLLIVDSLGPAARGNLNDPEPAIRYFEALRQLGITSLTLAHCAKDQLTKRRSVFGSVYFTNLARSVWESKAEQEPGEDEAIISLKHTKANLSQLHPALGYKFTFANDKITVVKADLRDTALSSELPLSVRIRDLLRGGAMPVKHIAEALEANEASVKTVVNRLAKKGVTIKVGESWALKA